MTPRPALAPWVTTLTFLLLAGPRALAAEAESAAPGAPLAAGYLSQLLGGLVLVILAIVILAWFLRRVPGIAGQGQTAIQILAVRAIGTRERLMLVQVGEEQILIGVTATGVRHLHTLGRRVELAAEEPWPGDFASLLKHFKSGGSRR
ncbi:flagellar biosynthetic protein FliO [Thiocystis violacea]|nr:flagellar biosynthetic protein FliO [Thiocystis violacea]